MRIGPDDIHTIRKNSEERTIKRFIAQKIGNLKKADIVKRSRAEGDTSWNETTTEWRPFDASFDELLLSSDKFQI